MEIVPAAVALIIRSMVLSARYAGRQRLLWLDQIAAIGGDPAELARLREENRRLTFELGILKHRFAGRPARNRHTAMERLQILWHMAYHGIPRRRVTEHFLLARSTYYRWLHAAERGELGESRTPAQSRRNTPAELARMIWDIFESNPHFGRNRIANTLWLLNVFVAASTVRNVLLRPKPATAPVAVKVRAEPSAPRQIIARYPNHVWSVDRTRVLRWGLWPTWVLVTIDHFSRKLVACCPLEGPNAGWVVGAMEDAFARHGAPAHMITDREGVFVSGAFRELLSEWRISHRFGAVGRHGSIAVTERVILTLKQEWLRRVPVIRGLDHLSQLLEDFATYYNDYRGHTTLSGALPSAIYRSEQWRRPAKSAKAVPAGIERRVFADAGVIAYRLAA